MKNLVFILATLISLPALAIKNSQLDQRHQNLMKKSIAVSCHLPRINLQEVSTEVTERRIDQGITDYDYLTVLKGTDKIDQGITDQYIITVKSHYSDSYDHQSREWGIYYVSQVQCELI